MWRTMQLADASWCCLLSFLLSWSRGDEQNSSDFLHLRPSSPAFHLLSFTTQSSCGHLLHIHAGLPPQVWDPEMPTVLIVPGIRSAPVLPRWVRRMCQELLSAGQGNVLAVDWMTPLDMKLTEAAGHVGREVAQTIRRLTVMGSDPEKFHLIGFGVGAHIAGIAGSLLNGTVGRITGLDPFGPVFSQADTSVRLDYSDGQYVDVIHTNFNPAEPLPALGLSVPIGHVDFYIGNGHQLAGCPQGLIKREQYLLCSHHRAHQIYSSSIRGLCQHLSFPCHSVMDFHHALCTRCHVQGLHSCPEMGFNISWLPKSRPFPFQPLTTVLAVTPDPPYCVTPLLLELKLGGNLSVSAKLFIQLRGKTHRTSDMLVSGPSMVEFVGGKTYQFMVSSDKAGHFQTISLEFTTNRLLYLEWRKRRVSVHRLLLSYLPKQRRTVYRAGNFTAVENQRTEVVLQRSFEQDY